MRCAAAAVCRCCRLLVAVRLAPLCPCRGWQQKLSGTQRQRTKTDTEKKRLNKIKQTNTKRSRALTFISNERHMILCRLMHVIACISYRYVCSLICVAVTLTKMKWRDPGPGLICFFFCLLVVVASPCPGSQGHRSKVRSGGARIDEAGPGTRIDERTPSCDEQRAGRSCSVARARTRCAARNCSPPAHAQPQSLVAGWTWTLLAAVHSISLKCDLCASRS